MTHHNDNTYTVNTLADLRKLPAVPTMNAFLAGVNTLGDGLGGFYYFDPNRSDAEDLTFYNIIASNIQTGRWVRTFVKAQILPQGSNSGAPRLVFNGGVKTLYVPSVTDANGQATAYATMDGTATGTAVFTEVWDQRSYAVQGQSGLTNSIQYYQVSTSADFKTFKHGYYKPNALTITLGLVYSPLSSIGAGTVTQFAITGI